MTGHIHLIGIGGIGMSAIAVILLRKGMNVSGSDLKRSRMTDELEKMGADIFIGHDNSNCAGADIIVYSSAVKQDNPELEQARRLNIPVLKRAEALAELMREKTVITVAGSHGKTTTSSLVYYLLSQAGLLPSAAIGGISRNIDANACFGEGKFFVAEADESDGSFLYYNSRFSIITNIDYEHLDFYADFEHVLDSFRKFMDKTAQDGCLFCCDDDVNLKTMLEECERRHVLFGLRDTADIYPRNIMMQDLFSEFDCIYKHNDVGRFRLALGGLHNISNALSVIALGLELGIKTDIIRKALLDYKGTKRRIEVKFRNDEFILVDDYAHHPTEIKATLNALKNMNSKRIVAVFQPHRYSRTRLLLDSFRYSFDAADHVIITDIYPAGEPPIEGVSGRSVYEKIREHMPAVKNVDFIAKDNLVEYILRIIKPRDLIVTLGAGDITGICDEIEKEFRLGTSKVYF